MLLQKESINYIAELLDKEKQNRRETIMKMIKLEKIKLEEKARKKEVNKKKRWRKKEEEEGNQEEKFVFEEWRVLTIIVKASV